MADFSPLLIPDPYKDDISKQAYDLAISVINGMQLPSLLKSVQNMHFYCYETLLQKQKNGISFNDDDKIMMSSFYILADKLHDRSLIARQSRIRDGEGAENDEHIQFLEAVISHALTYKDFLEKRPLSEYYDFLRAQIEEKKSVMGEQSHTLVYNNMKSIIEEDKSNRTSEWLERGRE